jgi:5-formyltetrahydrofolate cyclo-ligase
MDTNQQSLRAKLKAQRQSLSDDEVAVASEKIANSFWQKSFVQRISNLAVYMSVGGEINCTSIIEIAWLRKKNVFAPILRGNRLNFAPLKQDSKWVTNHFGILEPIYKNSELIKPQQLDIVVTPLLAFDEQLNRVGMGGGFYDRSFAFCKRRRNYRRPRLVGVAHSFQKVKQISSQPWDVPLNSVITEKETIGSY